MKVMFGICGAVLLTGVVLGIVFRDELKDAVEKYMPTCKDEEEAQAEA